jgi:hypothetical protein
MKNKTLIIIAASFIETKPAKPAAEWIPVEFSGSRLSMEAQAAP